MEQELRKRLYDMEVTPPVAVWEKLSSSLDEINRDFLVAGKIKNTAIQPPAEVWDNIRNSLQEDKGIIQESRGAIFYVKRFAAAAIFTGLIFTAWFLFNNKNDGIVSEKIKEEKNVQNKVTGNPSAGEEDQNKGQVISDITTGGIPVEIHKQTRQMIIPALPSLVPKVNLAEIKKQKPGEKIFTPTVDDLSLVGDGENYLTMLNANGRLVKITPQMAHLAPQLQDKPVTRNYYEIMFGEDEYWKETLHTWRKQLAISPVGSGDLFGSLVELLKSVNNN